MILRNEILRLSPLYPKRNEIQEDKFLFHSAYKDKEGKIRVHLIPCPKMGIFEFYYIVLDKVEDVEVILIRTGEFVD